MAVNMYLYSPQPVAISENLNDEMMAEERSNESQ
jgi:hypothetical protein